MCPFFLSGFGFRVVPHNALGDGAGVSDHARILENVWMPTHIVSESSSPSEWWPVFLCAAPRRHPLTRRTLRTLLCILHNLFQCLTIQAVFGVTDTLLLALKFIKFIKKIRGGLGRPVKRGLNFYIKFRLPQATPELGKPPAPCG